MAIAPPELTVKVKIDTGAALDAELKRTEAKLIASAKEGEQKAANAALAERAKGQARLDNAREAALLKQKLSWEKHLNSIALSEEKARLKSIKGQESWSARMTKSLDSVAFAVKGMAAAWVTAQVASIVRNSLQLAGGMRDMAAGVQLSTQNYFALTSALRDAGVQAEKIDPIFTRLNDLISGGATPQQQTILDRLGINATGMTNVQFMDTLLEKINNKLITQAELGELVGNRVVPAWNRLANEINNVNEANSRYKFPLTDAEVDTLDRAARAWDTFSVRVSLAVADATLSLDSFFKWYRARIREDLGIEPGEALPTLQFMGPTAPRSSIFSLPEQTITAPARTLGASGAGRAIPSPVDANGRRLRRGRPEAADRSFDLPQISRDLPTVTRATEEWAQQLSNSLTLAEQIEFRISRIASSNTWQVATAGAQAFTNILSMQAQVIQNEVDALNHVMQMERERWQIRSEAMREAGQENSAAYRNELKEFERLDAQRQKKANQLQAKAFEVNKKAQIAGTVMNTSQSIMNALATVKPFLPVGLIMAALAGAQGALQVSTIAGQQNPYKSYAFGGYVPGQSLGDDTMINVTGGEFVTTREATRNNRAALEFANKGGILRPDGSNGGITVIIQGDIVGDDAYVENRLIPRLQKAIDRGYRLQTR